MHGAAPLARPLAVCKTEVLLDPTTTGAPPAARKETIHLRGANATLLSNMLKDRHEFRKAEVTDLTSPAALHALDVQILKGNEVVALAERMGRLEEPVPTLVAYAVVDLRKADASSVVVVRPPLLAAERAVGFSHLLQTATEKLGRANLCAVAQREEALQAEVQPHRTHYRLVWGWRLRLFLCCDHTETDPESPYTVPLDRDGLDFSLNRAREYELVGVLANADSITSEVVPPGLLQGEGGVAVLSFEAGPSGLWIREEPPVGPVKPLDHVLHGL